jgi:hypothetical protein
VLCPPLVRSRPRWQRCKVWEILPKSLQWKGTCVNRFINGLRVALPTVNVCLQEK